MPQPLRRSATQVVFSADAMTNRPDLAVAIARIVARWSILETNVGRILSSILQAEAPIGVSMYLALIGSAGQDAVVLAAATERLSGDEQIQLRTLLSDVRTRAKERNRIVHGMWGFTDSAPDKIIWKDQRDSARDHADFAGALHGAVTMVLEESDVRNAKDCVAYTKNDFKDIEERISQFDIQLSEFDQKLFKKWLNSLPTAPSAGDQ